MAGENIRELAQQRKQAAQTALFKSVGSGAVGLVLAVILLSQSPGLAIAALGAGLFFAWLFFQESGRLTKAAANADQGAAGEENIAQLLQPLEAEGWRLEHNVMLTERWDVDIVATSPNGKIFVIDVKSHQGFVVPQGQTLIKMLGKKKFEFEKDFCKGVKSQAMKLKELRGIDTYVQAVLCFSRATLHQGLTPDKPFQSVLVVRGDRLAGMLRVKSTSK